jgi:WD40 repeat protein
MRLAIFLLHVSAVWRFIVYIDALWKVCGLEWNRHENEIVSAHGYSNNEPSVWSYPSMEKVADINYHKKRVLELRQVVSRVRNIL